MEHDERWLSIERSPLHQMYLGEFATTLMSAIEAGKKLREIAPPDVGNVIKVDRQIGLSAGHLVSAAGRLQTLLFPAPRSNKESAKRWELRRRRCEWLRNTVFADIDMSVLNDRGVRNSIEHFDDRLDEIAEKATDGRFEFPVFVVSDVALGHPNILSFFQNSEHPPKVVENVRTYIASTQEFHVLRWSFSVAAVVECCELMLDRLGDWMDGRSLESPQGSIQIIGQRPRVDKP